MKTKDKSYEQCFSGTLMTLTVLVLVGCLKTPERADKSEPPLFSRQAEEPNDPDVLREKLCNEKWGINIESAQLSAAGYIIDFRFRVLDAAKAAPILDRRTSPILIAQATGAKFSVPNPPKVGQLRSGGNIKEGSVCFILFANPAKHVKSGQKVTVVVGDFHARDIIVQ